jgi:hypothetical protein
MKKQPRISGVYGHGPDIEPSPDVKRQKAHEAKREAWQRHGVLMIDPEDINNDWDKQHVINIAEQFYGRRGKS